MIDNITCGHNADAEEFNDTALRGYTREDERCVDYVTLCRECYTIYKTDGLVLFSTSEENKWLNYNEQML